MIPVPTGVRVWLATGHTDMRCGFPGLALKVQEVLRRDPLSGHLFVFRGRRWAVNTSTEALIAHLKLEIEKLRRALYGNGSERKARLLEQMELQLEELETAATEDELAAEKAAAQTQTVKSLQRKRPSRKPFPDHLPRERVVILAPAGCP